ncbi:hypothetical protein SAMN02910456_01283 [Ruminococcaceae bacterium YRB3002]|nr:hypothetical protein SAMN02910456_01283 [Ruminococcaceae bacterium YRB3002]
MRRYVLTFAFILAGTALIVTGVILGDPASVLSKAIRICMECVGIG